MNPIEKHPRYEEAVCHVREVSAFYTHALVYILVIGGLAALNLLNNPGRLWFIYAAMGWGVGLLVHGLRVFAMRNWLGREWQARKVREYLERHG